MPLTTRHQISQGKQPLFSFNKLSFPTRFQCHQDKDSQPIFDKEEGNSET